MLRSLRVENARPRALLAALALVLGVSAPTWVFAQDSQISSPSVLQVRIQTIELDREASSIQFRADKKACATVILVSRCTSEALVRRRSRDAVLRDGQISAKEQLRAMAAKAKNEDLASAQARSLEAYRDAEQREAVLAQRAKKLADVQERLDTHQQKKNQEEDNRRIYREKVQRSEEKQAEIRARFKDSGVQPKAGGPALVTPGIALDPVRKSASTASAN